MRPFTKDIAILYLDEEKKDLALFVSPEADRRGYHVTIPSSSDLHKRIMTHDDGKLLEFAYHEFFRDRSGKLLIAWREKSGVE